MKGNISKKICKYFCDNIAKENVQNMNNNRFYMANL